MPLSKEQLSQILAGHARQLCSAEMNEGQGGGFQKSSSYDRDAAYDRELEQYDKMLYGNDVDESEVGIYSASVAANSKMPEDIKRSMMEHRIDTSAMDPNASVLTKLNIPVPKKETRRQITEQVMPAGGGVDYSVIKAIVNECLNEYFKNNKLNESTLAGIGLKAGKITLVDNKGETYWAQLRKVDNNQQQ